MQKIIIVLAIIVAVGAGVYFFMGDRIGSEVTSTPGQNTGTTNETPDTLVVQIPLIALEDNGASGKKIGCNDSVVMVDRTIPYTTGTLRGALEVLLSLQGTAYGQSGLYNAVGTSDLELADVTIEGGTAIIELEGQLVLQGACDAPRVAAQLEEAALQFDTVDDTEITINGEPLADALSSQ